VRVNRTSGPAECAAGTRLISPFQNAFKNLRNYLYDHGALPAGTAPSYFVESLISNVPDEQVGYSYQRTVLSILVWLRAEYEAGRFGNFVCGNGFISLFGNVTDKWNYAQADLLIAACTRAWVSW
jgi:hypothetical protein